MHKLFCSILLKTLYDNYQHYFFSFIRYTWLHMYIIFLCVILFNHVVVIGYGICNLLCLQPISDSTKPLSEPILTHFQLDPN